GRIIVQRQPVTGRILSGGRLETAEVDLHFKAIINGEIQEDGAVIHVERLQRQPGGILENFIQIERERRRLRRFQQGFQLARAYQRLLQQVGVLDGNRSLVGDNQRQIDLLAVEPAHAVQNFKLKHA